VLVGGEINEIVEIADTNDEYDKLDDFENLEKLFKKKTCGPAAAGYRTFFRSPNFT